MQNKFFNKKIFNRKTIIILSVLVCIVVIISIFSNSFEDAVKEAVKPDESKLSQTYNASRYFFRVGYSDDWFVEKDEFGFLMDAEKGLVIQMLNKKDVEQASGSTQAPVETPAGTGADVNIENDYTTIINFFYRQNQPDDVPVIKTLDACKRYMDEFVSGLMYGEEYKAEYKFGSITDHKADKEIFSCVTYKCELYGYVVDANGVKTLTEEPIENFTGEIFAATRNGAYYAVNFETTLDTNSKELSEYRQDFENILNDFRFSVFDD